MLSVTYRVVFLKGQKLYFILVATVISNSPAVSKSVKDSDSFTAELKNSRRVHCPKNSLNFVSEQKSSLPWLEKSDGVCLFFLARYIF